MKTLALFAISMATFVSGLNAQETAQKIQVDLPESLEKFHDQKSKLDKTPQGTAALFVAALYLYGKDQTAGTTALAELISPKMLIGKEKPTISHLTKGMIDSGLKANPMFFANYFNAGVIDVYGGRSPLATGEYRVHLKPGKKMREVILWKDEKGNWKVTSYMQVLTEPEDCGCSK